MNLVQDNATKRQKAECKSRAIENHYIGNNTVVSLWHRPSRHVEPFLAPADSYTKPRWWYTIPFSILFCSLRRLSRCRHHRHPQPIPILLCTRRAAPCHLWAHNFLFPSICTPMLDYRSVCRARFKGDGAILFADCLPVAIRLRWMHLK